VGHGGLVSAQDHNSNRAAALSLAHDLGHAAIAEELEGIVGMFEKVVVAGDGGGRCEWGKVDEPTGVNGEAAHDFEHGLGVFLANADGAVETSIDGMISDNVLDVESGPAVFWS